MSFYLSLFISFFLFTASSVFACDYDQALVGARLAAYAKDDLISVTGLSENLGAELDTTALSFSAKLVQKETKTKSCGFLFFIEYTLKLESCAVNASVTEVTGLQTVTFESGLECFESYGE